MFSLSSAFHTLRLVSRLNIKDYRVGFGFFRISAMAQPRVKVGVLVPLKENEEADSSCSTLTIFQGSNTVGRNDLPVANKQVSRKHVSLNALGDGSAEILVEGQNPIILKSGTSRKKLLPKERAVLADGDIVELIPGKHPFKYKVALDDRKMESPSTHTREGNDSYESRIDAQESIEAEKILLKRKRQVLEDEAFAKTLQAIEIEQANGGSRGASSTMNMNSGGHVQVDPKHEYVKKHEDAATQKEISEPISHFNVPKEILSSRFRLMRVQGLPAWANTGSVTIGDVIQWPGCNASLPLIGDVKINVAYFRRFDFSGASVRLIASVPGYHHGPKLKKWGHMKLRTILQDQCFEKGFEGSPLVYQFSSLGSLDEKWMAELASSMCSGSTNEKQPLGSGSVQIIWPTVEDVRCSLEGYAAGNAIPSPQKNVEKEFLKKYWAHWQGNHSGRCRAMPHIKTYARYNGESIAWFLLTSANLSKAAWGALQKNGSQLMIRSYELGVLFLPSLVLKSGMNFSCTDHSGLQQGKCDFPVNQEEHKGNPAKLVSLCWQGEKRKDLSFRVVTLPVPYKLPPSPYTSEDVPWSWDRQYRKPDVYGEVWPRSVKLYTSQET